jgi:prepilin-type N-terminal cleavage/methylation domain-containing protein
MPTREGFTLIELMIVVVIIGILAAMAIPNYVSMQDHAKEASTKSNAHTVQMAVEDYAVSHDGVYSVAAADITPLLPGQGLLVNVWSGAATEPQFGAPAANPGELGVELVVQNGAPTGYQITAAGRDGNILTLINGQ